MRSLIAMLLLVLLSACAPQKEESSKPNTPANPNEPSLKKCQDIEANVSDSIFVNYSNTEVMMFSGKQAYFITEFGGLTQASDGIYRLGSFCSVEIDNGLLTSVIYL